MSWMIAYDVREGRAVLNYSEWDTTAAHEHTIEETVDLVSKNLMPLRYYTILHPKPNLSSVEKGQLINGLNSDLFQMQSKHSNKSSDWAATDEGRPTTEYVICPRRDT